MYCLKVAPFYDNGTTRLHMFFSLLATLCKFCMYMVSAAPGGNISQCHLRKKKKGEEIKGEKDERGKKKEERGKKKEKTKEKEKGERKRKKEK